MDKKILVVYKSKTGFTKKYAQMIAEELGCEAIDGKQADSKKLSGYDTVVYGGRIFAGMVDGYKKMKEMYDASAANELVVFATGGTPNEAVDTIEKMWAQNFTGDEIDQIPHFYMQGGISYERMGFMERKMMKMAAKMMAKNKDLSPEEQGFMEAIKSSYDISDKKYINPLVEYLRKRKL